MTVTVTGHFDVPEALRDQVPAELQRHRAASLAEPGCQHFDVRPDTTTPGRYLVNETFADSEAFDAHRARISASPWAEFSRPFARHYRVEDKT
jgi:quinol monooxygenase YgiN